MTTRQEAKTFLRKLDELFRTTKRGTRCSAHRTCPHSTTIAAVSWRT